MPIPITFGPRSPRRSLTGGPTAGSTRPTCSPRSNPTSETSRCAIVNDLAALDEPVVIVIDDLQFASLAAPSLTTSRTPTLQLSRAIIGSRTEPQLALHRLRAHGQLVEVRDAELRLTQAEVAAVMFKFGIELNEVEVEFLTDRTEGWAAGVQMAAVALRDETIPEVFLTEFANTPRSITDFLGTEDARTRSNLRSTHLVSTHYSPSQFVGNRLDDFTRVTSPGEPGCGSRFGDAHPGLWGGLDPDHSVSWTWGVFSRASAPTAGRSTANHSGRVLRSFLGECRAHYAHERRPTPTRFVAKNLPRFGIDLDVTGDHVVSRYSRLARGGRVFRRDELPRRALVAPSPRRGSDWRRPGGELRSLARSGASRRRARRGPRGRLVPLGAVSRGARSLRQSRR